MNNDISLIFWFQQRCWNVEHRCFKNRFLACIPTRDTLLKYYLLSSCNQINTTQLNSESNKAQFHVVNIFCHLLHHNEDLSHQEVDFNCLTLVEIADPAGCHLTKKKKSLGLATLAVKRVWYARYSNVRSQIWQL